MLAAYAFDCANLLYANKNNNYFSPRKERKEKEMKKKKIMQVQQQFRMSVVKVFWKKILPEGWRFFFKNPQGLTLTTDILNC